MADDDVNFWAQEYRGLVDFQPTAIVLLFSLLPFAVQASALIAENAAVPLLVMDTMKYHVENFIEELDQYLTILAVHKGTLAEPDSGLHGVEAIPGKKKAMVRDMALSWRMKKFIGEIEHDSAIINSGVGLMVLNIICHVVPLNFFMFQPISGENACVPSWLILFTLAQFFGLMTVINRGIQCNDLTEAGIDSLLHEWQLKFNMIGWSGGFIAPSMDKGSSDYDVFVPRNPEGERFADIEREEAAGHAGYGVKIQAEQQHRLTSIVKVLAHYEAQTITPLKVVGITVTQDMMTIIFGFFGAQIIAFVSTLMDDTVDGTVQGTFMCHAHAFAGMHPIEPATDDGLLYESFQEAFHEAMEQDPAAAGGGGLHF